MLFATPHWKTWVSSTYIHVLYLFYSGFGSPKKKLLSSPMSFSSIGKTPRNRPRWHCLLQEKMLTKERAGAISRSSSFLKALKQASHASSKGMKIGSRSLRSASTKRTRFGSLPAPFGSRKPKLANSPRMVLSMSRRWLSSWARGPSANSGACVFLFCLGFFTAVAKFTTIITQQYIGCRNDQNCQQG